VKKNTKPDAFPVMGLLAAQFLFLLALLYMLSGAFFVAYGLGQAGKDS
jgi:hypothetical protein